MLLAHSLSYLFYRGVPGLVNFIALAVYTRLLTPGEFGAYALVFAAVALVDVVGLQWARLVVLRFLPAAQERQSDLMGNIRYLYSEILLVCTVAALLVWPAFMDSPWAPFVLIAPAMQVFYSRFELSLAVSSAMLNPVGYGRLVLTKSLLSLATGSALALAGLGGLAPILGLMLGYLVTALLFSPEAIRRALPKKPSREVLARHFAYGWPLALGYAMLWIFMFSDRFMIAWFLGEDSVGVYAAGSDIVLQVIGLLLLIIHTAAFPILMKAHEQQGREAAIKQLKLNGELLFTVSGAAAVGIMVLGPALIPRLIDEKFVAEALIIMPFILLSSVFNNIKCFYFDSVFHIESRTPEIFKSAVLAALGNVLLNLFMIPAFGVEGAAMSSAMAAFAALLASMFLGRFFIAASEHLVLLAKPAIVSGVLFGVLYPFRDSGLWAILGACLLAGAVFVVLMVVLDISHARQQAAAKIKGVADE